MNDTRTAITVWADLNTSLKKSLSLDPPKKKNARFIITDRDSFTLTRKLNEDNGKENDVLGNGGCGGYSKRIQY